MPIGRTRLLAAVNIAAYIALIVVNVLAIALPLNGATPGQVAAEFPNLFTPAPPAFSIWSLIYLLLLFFVLYQAGVVYKTSRLRTVVVQTVGWLFVLSCVFNIGWLFAFTGRQLLLSFGLIVGLLITLIVLYLRLNSLLTDKREFFAVKLPFSVYFGWITVAVIANVAVYLTSIGFDGGVFSETLWTAVVLLLGLVLASVVILRYKDGYYGLAVLWAYVWILVRHLSPAYYDGAYPLVIVNAAAAALLLAAFSVYALVKRPSR